MYLQIVSGYEKVVVRYIQKGEKTLKNLFFLLQKIFIGATRILLMLICYMDLGEHEHEEKNNRNRPLSTAFWITAAVDQC
jgi:hypothetical protein